MLLMTPSNSGPLLKIIARIKTRGERDPTTMAAIASTVQSCHGSMGTTGSDFQHLGIRQTIRRHLISSAGHMGVHVAPTP